MSQRRFSQNGQQALVRAYQAAREMGHAVIEPEHLLLGVLGEESALLKEWNGLEKQAAAPNRYSQRPTGAQADHAVRRGYDRPGTGRGI